MKGPSSVQTAAEKGKKVEKIRLNTRCVCRSVGVGKTLSMEGKWGCTDERFKRTSHQVEGDPDGDLQGIGK